MENREEARPQPPARLETLVPHTQDIASYSQRMLSQQTAFVGRQSELARIETLFNDPGCRLLTLVGMGGMGKTRIASEAASQLAKRFTHGSYFVALVPVSSPNLVASTIAAAIGLFLIGTESPRTQLINYLHNQHLLLVLDNFEHVLDAAGLLSEILQAAPGVRLLVTSRERLNVQEEWVIDIAGLDYPQTAAHDAAADYSAIEFFVKCAKRVKTDFELTEANRDSISRICRLVEGLPLGIELAASWVRTLSCRTIGDKIETNLDFLTTGLRNALNKHRSMRVVFEHSYALLTPEQQQVFRHLTIFRGSFRYEAAEAVINTSLVTLAALVDKSLVHSSADGLYTIHERLRQYGLEQLSAADELVATRERHCDYYTSFLAACWPRLTGSEIKTAMLDIEAELENVRAAWDWAIQNRKVEAIENSLNSLWFFYGDRALYQEGEHAFAKAAAIFEQDDPDSITMRAKIEIRQGSLCQFAGFPDKANALLRASVASLRHTSSPHDLALALHRLAVFLLDNYLAFPEAEEYLHESLALFKELDDHWGIGHVLNWLSILYHKQSAEQGAEHALEQAQHYAQECLSVFKKLDSPWGIASAYMNLADVAYLLHDYEACWNDAEKSLRLFRELGIFWGISVSLCLMGQAAFALKAYADAKQCVLQAIAVDAEYRLVSVNHFSLHYLALAAQIWLHEGQLEVAYELLALINEQFWKSDLSRRQYGAFAALDHLNDKLPPHLVAAVERGKSGTISSAIKEVTTSFNRSMGQGKQTLSLFQTGEMVEALTHRELEVLRLLGQGYSNSAIAQALVVSVGTIKAHTNSIYSKLGVDTRVQAVTKAHKLGIH